MPMKEIEISVKNDVERNLFVIVSFLCLLVSICMLMGAEVAGYYAYQSWISMSSVAWSVLVSFFLFAWLILFFAFGHIVAEVSKYNKSKKGSRG